MIQKGLKMTARRMRKHNPNQMIEKASELRGAAHNGDLHAAAELAKMVCTYRAEFSSREEALMCSLACMRELAQQSPLSSKQVQILGKTLDTVISYLDQPQASLYTKVKAQAEEDYSTYVNNLLGRLQELTGTKSQSNQAYQTANAFSGHKAPEMQREVMVEHS